MLIRFLNRKLVMSLLVGALSIGASLPLSRTAAAAGSSPYGLMIGPTYVGTQGRIALAQSLGVTYYRPSSAVFLDRGPDCAECAAANAAGLKLVLTVRPNGGSAGYASRPPASLDSYKASLRTVLERYRPAIVAIGNEPNSSLFYRGTASDYLAELQAGCQVAHEVGVACTDGGLTSQEIAGLVARDYLDAGQTDQAVNFARRSLTGGWGIYSTTGLQRKLNGYTYSIGFGRDLLAGYRAAGVDYLNFHWYIGDRSALIEAVQYLRRAGGGLPVMTNEIGQATYSSSQTLTELTTARDLGLPVVIWYSIDTYNSRALTNSYGTLRTTGQVFKNFIFGQ